MKYFSRGLHLLIFTGLIVGCRPKKQTPTKPLPEDKSLSIYRASVTQVNDLVHTSLDLEPDFLKKELKGRARLTIAPHFYPTDSLILDARYMRILSVARLSWNNSAKPGSLDSIPLAYTYDSLKLRIRLDKRQTKEDNYQIQIHYVAQPEKVKKSGSAAISDARGIYFINTDRKIADKPVQIWTQGETEAAACWFPTIDAPNQKSSQEIRVIVPEQYKTISNGKFMESQALPGNRRLDYWKQDLPHAPYLFALVIGEFAEIKDQWQGKPVNYYVEPAYEPYARMVFGHTPQMLEFYSNILQVPYPWDKFHQVVVRDFVSGAMENTGCVVHYDKLQHNRREHLDNTHEDIVAHELFHHWFGDLVTCESWSNLPLNESFATYGEYMWDEFKYGRNEADVKLQEFHKYYFREAEYKTENLIRYHYVNQEDMFDRHSYQKGGSILHMLRKYTGDDAFYAALKLYLTTHQFKTAEVADLRIAFEKTTGEDLNWFFNQWFLDKGHPQLRVFHQTYNGSGALYGITVVQKGKLFKLPVDVDVYTEKGVERHRLMVEKDSQTFGIRAANKPLCVIFDAQNQLLAEMEETKTIDGWESQLKYAPLSSQRVMALYQLSNIQQDKSKNIAYCLEMIRDSFWNNRVAGIDRLYNTGLSEEDFKPLSEMIRNIALHDPVSAVRKETIRFFRDNRDQAQLERMLEDSSYMVLGESLKALAVVNKKAALAYADSHRNEEAQAMQDAIFTIIGKSSDKDETGFFLENIGSGSGQKVYNSARGLAYFMMYNKSSKPSEIVGQLQAMAEQKSDENVSGHAVSAMMVIRDFYYYQLYYLKILADDKKGKKLYQPKIDATQKIFDRLEQILLKYPEE
jgi:aminopeptidase N